MERIITSLKQNVIISIYCVWVVFQEDESNRKILAMENWPPDMALKHKLLLHNSFSE